MFEDDGTARTKLLSHLGFNVPSEAKDTVNDDLSQEVNALGLEDTTVDNAGHVATNESVNFSTDNGEDFFNNLPSPKADTPLSTSAGTFVVAENANGSEKIQDDAEMEESSDPSFDDSVQHALVVGDYKGAVMQCISANKWADALVIAHVGNASLWESTRDQYLKMVRSPYLKVANDGIVICHYLTISIKYRPDILVFTNLVYLWVIVIFRLYQQWSAMIY